MQGSIPLPSVPESTHPEPHGPPLEDELLETPPTDASGLALPDPADVPTLTDRVATCRRSEHARFLSKKGFVSHDQECSECDDGELWTKENEVICANCYVCYDEEDRRRRDTTNPWERFWATRGTYRSGKTKLVGGYGSSYSWVSRSDLETEQSIADVEPGEFYG